MVVDNYLFIDTNRHLTVSYSSIAHSGVFNFRFKKIISAIQFWKVTSTAQACNVRFKMAARKQQVVDNTTRQFCFSKKENRLVVERYLRIV